MVGLADLKKHLDVAKKCNMVLNDKYCYFNMSGVNTIDFLDIVNYKSWVYKSFQKMVNIRYVYIIKKLEKGNTVVRTSVGFAPLLLRFLRIKGYQVKDEDIEVFRARNIIFPDLRIKLYDFQDRMVKDWMAAGGLGVIKCPTGGGKCLRKNSLILTDMGLIKVEDIICGITDSENRDKDCGQSNLYDSLDISEEGITDNAKIVKNVISISGKLKYGKYEISGRYDMGVSDLICLKTSMGYEISGTYEHKVIIIDDNGNVRFKKLEDITNNDYIALAINTNVFNDRLKLNFHFRKSRTDSNSHTLKNIEYMNQDIARLLGYMISEGTDNTKIAITNYDKEIQDDIVEICEKIGMSYVGLVPRDGKNNGLPVDTQVTSVALIEFMYYLGYRHGAKNKEVPWSILQADKSSQIAFIRSLFDGDGTVSYSEYGNGKRIKTKVLVEYYSSSYELCRQLQVILLNMGIISRLNTKKGASLEYRGEIREYEESYRLSIQGGEILKFANLIGFGLSRKQEILNECVKELEGRDRWTDVTYPNVDKKLKVLYERLKLMGKRGELIKTWEEDFTVGDKSTKITRRKAVSSREHLISHDFNKPMWAYISGERYPSKETLEKILNILSPASDMSEHKYLKTLSDRFIFDKVDSIKNEKEKVYDLTVNDVHSYIGNGIINHNTILACSIVKQIARKTLILVHTSDLLINVWNDSLVKSFGQGIMGQVGVIGGGLTDKDRAMLKLGVRTGDFDENIRKDVVIATFQTLMNRMDELTQYKFGLMIVDECIPVDSEIWTQDGVVKYEDLGHGQDYKRDVFQVWSRNNEDNIVNNGYKKIKTRMKHMYRTIVETGDELVCSLDHKVLTRKGDGKEEFVEIEKAKNIARSLVRPYDMGKDCIMARIFGYMIGDGNITYGETGFKNIRRRHKYYGGSVTGDYDGLLRMKYDIRKLGYKSSDIRETHSNSVIVKFSGKKSLVQGHGYSFNFANDLASRLVKLGYPTGDKTDIIYKIPDWIMRGSKDIKREFLAGYMGADGTTPYFDDKDEQRKRSFNAPLFGINKRQDLIEESMEIVDQLKKLFEEFGISFTRVNTYDSNIRKDGTITKTIQMVLTGDHESLKSFLEIGFRYCTERERLGDTILSYLKYIVECNKELKELQKISISVHDRIKKAPSKIINIINDIRSPKQLDIVSSWGGEDIKDTIKRKNLISLTASSLSHLLYEDQIVESPEDILGFKEWRNKVSGDFIFLDILRHEYRGYEQGYTLTIDKDHNYLVNGFGCRNCHHVPANMFRKVNAVIRAPYKLGLSATTTRLDGMEKDCFGQLGDIQSKVSIRELINRGILAEPRFQSPIIVDRGIIDSIQDSGLSGLNYSRLVKKKSASSQKKKDYVVNICKNIAARDRKFLLFTDYVNAEDVFVRDMYADSLLKEGTLVSVIDQGMASDERSAVFNFLERGDISGIVFGKLGSEGVNIPSVDVVVMANAIKCVSGDILIPTDKGVIKAEDLEIVKPSFVFTIDPDSGSVIMAKINEFYHFDEEDTIRIRTVSGYEIEGSTSHRIVTGWSQGSIVYTSLSDISIGNSVLICGNIGEKDIYNNRRLIFYDKVISKISGRNKLYDMNVDKYHSFIAGGFVNHNSPITFTQRVGRAMRRIPGKDWCDVYEVLLDLPTEAKWSDFNFAEYRAEGFQKLTYRVE